MSSTPNGPFLSTYTPTNSALNLSCFYQLLPWPFCSIRQPLSNTSLFGFFIYANLTAPGPCLDRHPPTLFASSKIGHLYEI